MKNFDLDHSKPDLDFRFGGEDFHAKGRLKWNTLLKFQDMKTADGEELPYIERIIWLIGSTLSKGEREKFETIINDEDDPKEATELDAIATWLIESYVGNGVGQSSSSSTGLSSTENSTLDNSSSQESAEASAPEKDTQSPES